MHIFDLYISVTHRPTDKPTCVCVCATGWGGGGGGSCGRRPDSEGRFIINQKRRRIHEGKSQKVEMKREGAGRSESRRLVVVGRGEGEDWRQSACVCSYL